MVSPEVLSEEGNPPFSHVPVLSQPVIAALQPQPGGRYLDATVGGAGHSRLILQAVPTGEIKLVAIDRDGAALAAAQERLAAFSDRVSFWRGNFAEYAPGSLKFDGILADLGVSSAHLDQAERGFSFRQSASLDMRMDQRQALTAAEIVNHWEEKALADTFYQYGEERLSRRIARRIVEQRPFQTTVELADAIAYSVPAKYRHGRIHPATRVFQALRIAVNQELAGLETFLAKAPDWLRPGGRLVVISFHSLEDRIVKHTLRGDERIQVITKKPIVATSAEISENPRSRSAKLRIGERKPPE
ncbi:16S rRNA (cytosine(1402)-N(4))-methyltransferase RsmH [Romeria aff. gracilis LEGE 07310]|uniref:Ribosomal RNA small subunit methyltransferase H n=1 Tax=Vasconcelosia minhoensis LEGE 07310 TaxID=915328 RepID=A0A8J7AFF8_9CYAN|nr:16S rRNA (cytosine(1402)-N(4))-methyltransferase RsmH [Romeria gracilis]MBE9076513.1 16S rRNA (cytosine(1402)-N(4))-methyltransferase RsmH [Romeria aff. gracilis LEGE 07310]